MLKSLSIAVCCLLLLACQGDKPTSEDHSNSAPPVETYPPIPQEVMKAIYNSTTGFDALFSILPVTISQVNAADANVHAAFIGPAEVPKQHGCTMDANMLFHNEEGIIADFHYFFTKGCNYVLYLEDGRPKYGGVLNPQGQKFYQNIILQAQAQAQQMHGQQ